MTRADPVATEAIRTLYLQLRNSAAAAAIVTIYMVATAWPHNSHGVVLAWLAVQLTTQVLREGLAQLYRIRRPDSASLPRWALAYTGYMAVAGMVWGSTIFLFANPEEPITVALTLCGLYGIAGGSVPGNAYNPPGLYAFAGLIFLCVIVRMLMIGTLGYPALGIASAGFAAILMLFCRVQARTIRDGFQIRFENRALLDELTVQKAEAEKARQVAEQANLAKSQFLAAASHDLRQPLYALALFSASLDQLQLDADARGVVDKIQENTAALESLFDGLLDISRLQAGVVQPRWGAVSVDELFDRLAWYFGPLAEAQGIDLRLRSGGEYVWSDSALLEQVLSNLVSNALRWTNRGRILIAARQRGEGLRFEVWDGGPGIAEADRMRIFDEFVQLDNPARDRRRGLGLGLSIVRRSVELLGGEIEVKSWVGSGSCFRFTQMLTPRADPVVASALPKSLARGFRSVMIVDDDGNVQQALSDLLGRWGVTFDLFGDGEAALAALAAGLSPTLLLADYRLPGALNGLDLIEAMRRLAPAPMPEAVLVTGDLDPGLIAAAQRGGVRVMHKPIPIDALRELLAEG